MINSSFCILLFFFILYSLNFSNIFGEQSITNSSNTANETSSNTAKVNFINFNKHRLIVTTELNKHKFIPGESVVISGTIKELVNQTEGIVKPYKGQLFVNVYELNKSKAEALPGILSDLFKDDNNTRIDGILIYTKEIFANGSFNATFETPQFRLTGQYVIVYSPGLNSNLEYFSEYELGHFDYFQVVQPWFTLWSWMFAISGIFGFGLLYLIFKSDVLKSFISFEILRFLCISGIILPILVGLLFIDSEWGTNSPISIVKLYGAKNAEQLANQWVIVIGGVRTDNYQSGVFIPIYVVIFGMIGGYLRYLYRTLIQRVNFDTDKIDDLIFSWNEVPGNSSESDKLKQYLIFNFDVPWISKRDFIRKNNKEINITSENGGNSLSLILNDLENLVELSINDKKYTFIAKSEGDKLLIYQKIPKKNWLFYQSLGDLTILFMAPLLSIITWFILTTGGTYNKYIIATVSLAVGLISENIINRLINFTETSFKSK